MSTFGERIRFSREQKGLSQYELANMVGAHSPGVISNWENNVNKPDAEKIVRLCVALGITLSYLLDYFGEEITELTPAEENLIRKYRRLGDKSQRALDDLADSLVSLEQDKAPSEDTFSISVASMGEGVEQVEIPLKKKKRLDQLLQKQSEKEMPYDPRPPKKS